MFRIILVTFLIHVCGRIVYQYIPLIFHLRQPEKPVGCSQKDIHALKLVHEKKGYVVITGRSSDEKVALVRAYIDNFNTWNKTNVLWLNCTTFTSMIADFVEIMKILQLEPKRKPVDVVNSTFAYFWNRPTIYVFENATKTNPVIRELNLYVGKNRKAAVIIISRLDMWSGNNYFFFNIKKTD